MGVLKEVAKGLIGIRPKQGNRPKILILTPVKNAAFFAAQYCQRLLKLTYPKHLISIGLLEGDSSDGTFEEFERQLPELRRAFRRVELRQKDFGFRLAPGQSRWAGDIQMQRRVILARSRNHLLFNSLADEEWVLWLDVDVLRFPEDILERLLEAGKDILQPHCVVDAGGPTFDRNAWCYRGKRVNMEDLRGEGEFVKLDALGGTMLLVRADLHRDGLIFPAFPYVAADGRVPGGYAETEGLGLMANDMGHCCWGMPNFEVFHCMW